MPNRLSDLLINEISLVDKAATRRKFLLTKADDAPETPENPGYITAACARLTKALLDAGARHRLDAEFVKTLGIPWEQWTQLSKAEQEQQQQDHAARGQIAEVESRLDAIAAELKRADPQLSYERAFVKAMDTAEGYELCKQLHAALALRR